MGPKTIGQPAEGYRRKYQDPHSAAEYHASQQAPRKRKEFLRKGRLVGWLVALAERRAISRLVRETGTSGLVLDVPCGGGKLNPVWNRRSRVLGVDSSRSMLQHFLSNGGLEALQGDIGSLPLKDFSAELVICNRLLHRVPPERRAEILGELRRVSSKWAVLYYAVFHQGRGWIVRVNRRLALADPTDVFLCTTKDARNEIRKSGWQIRLERSILIGVAAGHVFLVERA